MSNQNAQPGWYPVPDGRQRYWDGNRWTEHFAPGVPAKGAPWEPTKAMSTASTSGTPWYTSTAFIITAIVVVGFVLSLGIAGIAAPGKGDAPAALTEGISSSTPEPPASSAAEPAATESSESASPVPVPVPEPSQVEEPTGDFGSQPKPEAKFAAAAVRGQDASAEATNELKQGAALRTRSKALCAALSGTMKVAGWTGTVKELGANSDGSGVLSVEIADGVELTTWNNSLSDIGDETLIDPDSKLFDQVLALEEGQLVKFSGTFFRESDSCVEESSWTLGGNLENPEFIFKFSKVMATS